MGEVIITSLIHPSRDTLIGKLDEKGGMILHPDFGNVELIGNALELSENALAYYKIEFIKDGSKTTKKWNNKRRESYQIIEKIENMSDLDLREYIILFRAKTRTTFPKHVLEEAEKIQKESVGSVIGDRQDCEDRTSDIGNQESKVGSKAPLAPMIRGDVRLSPWRTEGFGSGGGVLVSLSSLFPKIENRTDFRSWYTITIDGRDAKDLDDAISLKQYANGDFLLGVHIADVAEYVTE